ncbi:MAG: T9SS type A sorting domain-containing protein, partial [Calditrichota bacterium]
SETKLSFFHGGNPPSDTPYLTMTRDLSGVLEPFLPSVTGDVNGDGYIDWYRLIRYEDHPDSTNVEVYLGGPDADLQPDLSFRIPVSSLSVTPRNGERFDYNGDGFDDLFVYIQIEDGDYSYILLGGNPMDTVPDLIFHSDPYGSQSALPRAFGDINGDGYGDFLTSDNLLPQTTYIYLGSLNPDTLPDYQWNDFRVGDVTMAPDLNGDHRSDLVISRFEAIDVHFGSDMVSETPNYTLNFFNCDGGPTELTSAGDFNGDGYGDLVAIDYTCNQSHGGLKLYLGHPWLNPDPALIINGRTSPLNLVGILHACAVGDINGDGVDDLAIGATVDQVDGRRGRVVILSGDTTMQVGVDDPFIPQPLTFGLSNYPNPFNATTTLSFSLSQSSPVSLTIFNLLGQAVYQADLGMLNAGEHQHLFNASELPSGVYLARVQAGELSQIQKMVLLK